MVALQEIQPLRWIPGPTLGLMESCAHSDIIADGHEAGVGVQSLPSLVPDGSVVAGEIAVISPWNGLVALKAGC